MRPALALVAAAAAVALAAPAAGADTALDGAMARARAESKPVIIEFYADWCEPCKQFEADVLPADVVKEALAGAVFVRTDFESSGGRALADRYQVKGLPMFLALDGTGRELLRLRGSARGTAWFVRFVRRARDLAADERTLVAELDGAGTAPDRGRDLERAEVRLKAARWYRARRRVREAIESYERAIELAPDRAIAAEAAHELAKLTAAVERRKRVIADAVEFVESFPESARAAEELAVAVLSGDLPEVRRRSLLQSAATRAPASSLESIAYVAMAAADSESALLAAHRLVALETEGDRAHVVLADAYLAADDRRAAAGAHAIACRRPLPALEALCAEQARRLPAGGTAPRTLELRRESAALFSVLEDPTVAIAGERRPRVDPALAAFVPVMRRRFAAAAAGCNEHRRQLREVWVRLELAGAGRPPADVAVLEPGAPEALIDCLRRALDDPMPPVPEVYRQRFVAPVRFGDAAPRRPPRFEEPALASPLHHAYLYLSGMAGVSDTLGAGTRAIARARRFGHFDAMLSWDVNAGVTSEGSAAYGVRALAGLAARPPSEVVRISLLSGVGASRIGDALPGGYEIPVELVLTISHPRVRGLAWTRTAWIFGAEERKSDRGNALFGGDEFSIGAGVRVPASSPYGTFLAAAYSRYANAQTISIMLGTSVDSFR